MDNNLFNKYFDTVLTSKKPDEDIHFTGKVGRRREERCQQMSSFDFDLLQEAQMMDLGFMGGMGGMGWHGWYGVWRYTNNGWWWSHANNLWS